MPLRNLALLVLCFGACSLWNPSSAHAELLVLPRLGFAFSGSGSMDIACSDSGAYTGICGTNGVQDTSDSSGFVLGLDLMTPLTQPRDIVVGGGVLFQAAHAVEGVTLLGKPLETLGTDLSLYGLVEYNVSIHTNMRIVARGQAGLFTLFTGSGDDLGKRNDDTEALCGNFGSANCTIETSPYFGWTAGLSLGAIVGIGDVGWRFDLLAERFNVDLAGYTIANDGNTLNSEVDYSSTRLIFLVGAELGRTSKTKRPRSRYGPQNPFQP